ncbi:MAG: DUF2934 domain-containing protein [Alphaproteobacteria bacterium]|nr:DUF2934 domain-containing protein [Alphaproteobacteria bacterium]
MQPTDAQIRERSYFIWEREGRPDGRDWDHWLRAEGELRAEKSVEAAPKPKPRRRTAPAPATQDGPAAAASKVRKR